jgi:hypothetical protein
LPADKSEYHDIWNRDICLGYQEPVLRSGGGTALLRKGWWIISVQGLAG